jgi:hypothetical protein
MLPSELKKGMKFILDPVVVEDCRQASQAGAGCAYTHGSGFLDHTIEHSGPYIHRRVEYTDAVAQHPDSDPVKVLDIYCTGADGHECSFFVFEDGTPWMVTRARYRLPRGYSKHLIHASSEFTLATPARCVHSRLYCTCGGPTKINYALGQQFSYCTTCKKEVQG